MLDLTRALLSRSDALRKAVRGASTAQVRRKEDRAEAKAIVDTYFRELREPARLRDGSETLIAEIDANMQALLEAAQKLSAKNTYDRVLRALSENLRKLELTAITASKRSDGGSLEPTDHRIVQTLSKILPSAAHAYEQALRDLSGPDRLSWRGPATDLRESLREALDHLAPDKAVMAQPGFKLEKDLSGPTMRQKVRFVLTSRGVSKTASASAEAAVEAVDEIIGGFVRSVYTRSSVSTHTPTDRTEVRRIHTYVRASLSELLEVHGSG